MESSLPGDHWEHARRLASDLQTPHHLDNLVPYLVDDKYTWHIDSAVDAINRALHQRNEKAVLLYDYLDKGVESNVDLRRTATTGLLIFWQSRFDRATTRSAISSCGWTSGHP